MSEATDTAPPDEPEATQTGTGERSGGGAPRQEDDVRLQQAGRLEERDRRQHAEQQHGDSFAVDSDEPTDTSGIERTPARTAGEDDLDISGGDDGN